jgi:hypothetical protein
MCALHINTDSLLQNGKFAMFHRVGKECFYINSVCILSENQILTRHKVYDLLDLLPDGKMNLIQFEFLNAVLRGLDFFIIGLDVSTGVVIHRKHRLDFGEKECDWLLISADCLPDE